MKISLASDVHLEFGPLELENKDNADVLILAGDIVIAQDLYDHTPESIQSSIDQGNIIGRRQLAAQNYRQFLNQASELFDHVIWVAGNHEFYSGRWYGSLDTLRYEASKFPNVHFLEDDAVEIDDITFIGCTLWTDLNNDDWHTKHTLKHNMNDYHSIKNDKMNFHKLHPDDTFMRHRTSKKFIEDTVADHDKQFVVVTHHAPSNKSVHAVYKDNYHMNGGYRSNLEDIMIDNENIKLWCHGHTHHQFDYEIGKTRVVCNPRGYIGYEPIADTFSLKTFEI